LRLFGLRLRHHDVLGCTGCSYYRELDEVSCIRLEASSYRFAGLGPVQVEHAGLGIAVLPLATFFCRYKQKP